jgi:hypothetical protein
MARVKRMWESLFNGSCVAKIVEEQGGLHLLLFIGDGDQGQRSRGKWQKENRKE